MLQRIRHSPFLTGFLGAFCAALGIVIGLTIIHLWSDHVALHVMLDFLNQHGETISKLPTP